MRCSNCGWDNPNELTRCEKCGQALASERAVEQASPVLSKTVREGDAPIEEAAGMNSCPKCGYPLRAGVSVCPNCQQVLAKGVAGVEADKPAGNSLTGTVRPMMNYSAGAWCSLEPQAFPDEKLVPGKVEFEDTMIELNRANLDPDNRTITSKVQAQLNFEKGQWTIQDRSALQTTFVGCKDPQPLKDGDTLLIGNRVFVFHC